MGGLPFEVLLRGVVTLSMVVLACVVLTFHRRRMPAVFLAVFLLLIGANAAFEAVRAYDKSDLWMHLAIASSALDPLFLYLFAAYAPVRNRLADPRRIALIAFLAVGFAGASVWMNPVATYLLYESAHLASGAATILVATLLPLGLSLFTACVYTAALAHAVREHLRDPAAVTWRLLYPAFCLAAIPVWVVVAQRVLDMATKMLIVSGWGYPALFPLGSYLSLNLIVLVLAASALHAAARNLGQNDHALMTGVLLAAAAVILTSFEPMLLLISMTTAMPELPLLGVGRASAALRWIVFGALISILVIRHQGSTGLLRTRRWGARTIIAVAVLAPCVTGLVVLQKASGQEVFVLRPVDWLFLLAIVGLSQGFRNLVDRLATNVYDLPPDHGRVGALSSGMKVAARYRISRLLGSGGSARTFLAHDELLRRDVAIKEIVHADAQERARALREARLCATVRHPNVVALHDVLDLDDATLLVVELHSGGSLADLLQRRGKLSSRETVRMIDGMLDGLAAIHAAGLVHRDIKPENILLDSSGRPIIGDFGIARSEGDTFPLDEDRSVGTWQFMAPEQRHGGLPTPAMDLYAVALVGRRCVAEPMSESLRRVFDRALEEDPSRRYRSACDMRRALRMSEGQDASAYDEEIAMLDLGRPPPFHGLEVEQGPVAVGGKILKEESGAPPDDPTVLRTRVGVVVQRDVDVAAATDRPLREAGSGRGL